jgi:hypothetical protein
MLGARVLLHLVLTRENAFAMRIRTPEVAWTMNVEMVAEVGHHLGTQLALPLVVGQLDEHVVHDLRVRQDPSAVCFICCKKTTPSA